jgi:hypothetical protein
LKGTNDFTQRVDMKKISRGIYIMRIVIDDKIHTKKIVIN